MGEKGAGKSTLLKMFNGLVIPDTGSVRVDGHNPSSREARHRVGMVFQQPADQLFCRTIYDEIAFGPLKLRVLEKRNKRKGS